MLNSCILIMLNSRGRPYQKASDAPAQIYRVILYYSHLKSVSVTLIQPNPNAGFWSNQYPEMPSVWAFPGVPTGIKFTFYFVLFEAASSLAALYFLRR